MVRDRWHSRYLKIFMVRNAYSFILRYYTLVNVPVVVTSFSLFFSQFERGFHGIVFGKRTISK